LLLVVERLGVFQREKRAVTSNQGQEMMIQKYVNKAVAIG
jgi:hypothetical protein